MASEQAMSSTKDDMQQSNVDDSSLGLSANDPNPVPQPPTTPPKTRVNILEPEGYEIYGVDAIWHNVYRGPASDWGGFRSEYNCTIEDLIQTVARHVREGKYFVISMSASKHSLYMMVGCELMTEEVFKDFHPREGGDDGKETR